MCALSVLLAATAFGCEQKQGIDASWPDILVMGGDCYSLVPSSFVPIASGNCDRPAYGSGWQAVLTPTAPHVIDGRFTGDEWVHVPPLQGQYTDVYIDVRGGNLYLLNDWHVNDQGSSEGCFNLFALEIGGRRLEVRVFSERIEVDGLDVTGDGTAGFGPSERYPEPHTMWEFRIPFASTSDVIVCAHDPASYSACLAPPTDSTCATQPLLTSEPTVFTIAADGSRVRRSVPPGVPRIPEGGPCGIELGVCEDGLSCDAEGGARSCRVFDWPSALSTCDDGMLGGVETDVDCGGDCMGCGPGALCASNLDCASASCEAGRCLETTFPCGAGECAGGVSYCRALSDTESGCFDAPPGCSSCECLPAEVAGCDCDDSVAGQVHVDCRVI